MTDRAERIRDILASARRRLAAGEPVDPDAIVRSNPELMPELATGLRDLIGGSPTADAGPTPVGSPDSSRDGVDAPPGPDDSGLELNTSEIRLLNEMGMGNDTGGINAPGPMTEQVGQYRLLDWIGEGAFGEVHRAERVEPFHQIVAVKLLKPGVGSPEVLNRFQAEQQALGLMNHPNIASVIDAGVSSHGRPYFVMEYVKGEPITRYCDNERLNIAERLALFADVGRAVHHAHQRGIIHRDIKPSNVLVEFIDGVPTPKVIDFGVAKALYQPLTAGTIFTQPGQMIGTLEYMSPEQADMNLQDIDTRSDVYSLGVLLYELLTGSLPFESSELRQAGDNEIRRIIREVDPPKPSTRLEMLEPETGATNSRMRRSNSTRLRRTLRGDLDRIVMACLEKNRTRRPASADRLVALVECYLSGDPLPGIPPRFWADLRRFSRRNRRRLMTAAFMSLLFLAAGTTAYSLRQARLQSRAAQAASLVEEANLASLVNPAVAEQCYLEAMRLAPNNPTAALELAWHYNRRGFREKAHDLAVEQIERFPRQRDFYLILEETEDDEALKAKYARRLEELPTRSKAADRARLLGLSPHENLEAIELCNESLAKDDPWDSDVFEERCYRYYHLALAPMDDALAEKARSIQGADDPWQAMLHDAYLLVRHRENSAKWWLYMGVAERQVAKQLGVKPDASDKDNPFFTARAAFDKAIELYPEFTHAFVNRSQVHGDLGDYDKALEDANRACTLRPAFAEGFAQRAWVHFEKEDWQQAARDYEMALRLNAQDRNAFQQALQALINDESEPAVIEAFLNRALEHCPSDNDCPFVIKEIGRRAFATGKYKEAEEMYSRLAAVAATPADRLTALHRRSWARGAIGDLAGYRTDAREAATQSGEDPYLIALRGMASWLTGDTAAARKDLQLGYGDPGVDEALLWLWALETDEGHTEAAARAITTLADRSTEEAADPYDNLLRRDLPALIEESVSVAQLEEAYQRRNHRCVIYFFAGLRDHVMKRPDAAATWFRKCVQTASHGEVEYALALIYLNGATGEP